MHCTRSTLLCNFAPAIDAGTAETEGLGSRERGDAGTAAGHANLGAGLAEYFFLEIGNP